MTEKLPAPTNDHERNCPDCLRIIKAERRAASIRRYIRARENAVVDGVVDQPEREART